ncbi:MAG: cytochrome B5 [Chloroflexi bacterium]|nr:cytochrome B5 [Chloroflexota bacterium]
MARRRFTRAELGECNGRGGRPAYIAYKGVVYDASQAFLWEGGLHQNEHAAGRDLTAALRDAPHGEEVLQDLPIAGELGD